MASVALDRPNGKGQPAKLYYAGWEPLAIALGQDVPPDTKENKVRRKHQYELVRRALSGLEAAGLIERQHRQPSSGVRQCFRLTLDPCSAAETAWQQPPQDG